MGSYYRSKHFSGGGGGSQYSKQQARLIPKFSRNDLTLILPVLKEVGKVIFPPAAIPLEILYQLYSHSDAIKEVSSAIMQGDYEKVRQVVITQAVKDGSGIVLGAVTNQKVDQIATSVSGTVNNSVKDEKTKELTKKVIEASVKGEAEGIQEKIIDYTVDKLKESLEDNESRSEQRN